RAAPADLRPGPRVTAPAIPKQPFDPVSCASYGPRPPSSRPAPLRLRFRRCPPVPLPVPRAAVPAAHPGAAAADPAVPTAAAGAPALGRGDAGRPRGAGLVRRADVGVRLPPGAVRQAVAGGDAVRGQPRQ